MANHVAIKKELTELHVLTWKKLRGEAAANSGHSMTDSIQNFFISISIYIYIFVNASIF